MRDKYLDKFLIWSNYQIREEGGEGDIMCMWGVCA